MAAERRHGLPSLFVLRRRRLRRLRLRRRRRPSARVRLCIAGGGAATTRLGVVSGGALAAYRTAGGRVADADESRPWTPRTG